MNQCPYCLKNEKLDRFAITICDLQVSTLYLFKEQSHPGRVTVAYREHIGDLNELDAEQLRLYFQDVQKASRAVLKAFHPDKINYGAYADTMHHLHFHLVPKYRDAFEWGTSFEGNPERVYLTDEEYAKTIEAIKAAL